MEANRAISSKQGSFVERWLCQLKDLVKDLDPYILPSPLRITNPNFLEKYEKEAGHIKELIHLLEEHTLDEEQLKQFSALYRWFDFCQEIYTACITDAAIIAQQPGFAQIGYALEYEFQKPDVAQFLSTTWNRIVPGSKFSYADCYATLCHTLGKESASTMSFLQDIAKDLTRQVQTAIDYEYLMSHFPQQMRAYLHRTEVMQHYQKYWFDKGKSPESLKKTLEQF